MAENPAEIQEGTPTSGILFQSWLPVLHRVPAYMRLDKKYIYEPALVPLGPYHSKEHPQLRLVEPLKDQLLDMVCMCAGHKSLLLRQIRERIGEIKDFYGGAHGYDDDNLAEMMLKDACFLKFLMEASQVDLVCRYVGKSGQLFISRDSLMLENQIPLWLISLIHPDYKSLLRNYLSYIIFGDDRMTQLPWSNGGGTEPIHLLEAVIRAYLSFYEPQEISSAPPTNKIPRTTWQEANNMFRSATDLKAKGIHFRRSSRCLADIKFTSFALYAELCLPFFFISYSSKVFFSNAVAFEMLPEAPDDEYGMTAYFIFMKTLIHDANDVKLLREKDILFSLLASDEDVVELFKSIDTYGLGTTVLFTDVKKRIEEHCKNKGKTWMAELINTKFKNPWTVIALAAAAFLLCLTVLQTYYTVNPAAN